MKRVGYTPAAIRDLDSIWDYTATNWDIKQADRYVDAIEELCKALASGERLGSPVVVRTPYLKHPCGRHMVYYRTSTEQLVVIRTCISAWMSNVTSKALSGQVYAVRRPNNASKQMNMRNFDSN